LPKIFPIVENPIDFSPQISRRQAGHRRMTLVRRVSEPDDHLDSGHNPFLQPKAIRHNLS
jgi:hypothetical protein